MNILILMAASDKSFQEHGYDYPQYLLEIQNKPIIQHTVESLEKIGTKICCIIKKSDQDRFFLGDALKIISNKCKVISLPNETRGALCSALLAIDLIDINDELLIVNGTQLIKSNLQIIINDFRSRSLDGGIVTFKSINPKYSSVLLDRNGIVIQTSEKRPISDIASTGVCYFKRGGDFIQSAFQVIEKDINTDGKYYISSTYNEMILNNKCIGVYEIPMKDYISFANYQMYESYISKKRGNA